MDLRQHLIQAVTDSALEMFTSLFSVVPVIEEKKDGAIKLENKNIMSSIGMAGKIDGSIILILDQVSACRIVSKMLSIDIKEVNSDVLDGVGEVVNILTGGMKRKLENFDYTFDISLPVVVHGGKDPATVIRSAYADCIEFNIECSDFKIFLILSFKVDSSTHSKDHAVPENKSQEANDMLGRLIGEQGK